MVENPHNRSSQRRRIFGLTGVRGERGSSMVEFAFVAVVLVTMVFGISAFGYAVYVYHGVSNLAREASRWASVNGYTCNSDRGTASDPNDVGSCTAPVTYDSTTGAYSLCTATTAAGGGCSPATTSDIQNYVMMMAGGLNPNGISTTASFPYDSSFNPTYCDPTSSYFTEDNAPGCTVEVQVSYTFTFPLIFVTKPITVTSSSEMIIEH